VVQERIHGVRWRSELAEGGWRWAGLTVGRSARAEVVWSGGNRADRQGVGMIGSCWARQPSHIASGSGGRGRVGRVGRRDRVTR
jgi:hypothetical protein